MRPIVNAYIEFAESQITAPAKRRMRAAEARAQRACEKELRERANCLRSGASITRSSVTRCWPGRTAPRHKTWSPS